MHRVLLAVALVAVQPDTVRTIFGPATGRPERPSAVVATVAGGRVEVRSFGSLDLRAAHPPNARTMYEIGSITKGLTGILLADMARAGEVSLHDRLDRFLPDAAKYPDAIRAISLRELATHSSGLPRLPANLMFSVKDPSNPYASYGRAELEAFLRGYTPPAGRTFVTPEYSNLGFGLLGHALSLAAGMPYETLLRTRVLLPLGMHDTAIALTEDQRSRLAPGHAKGLPVSNWDFDALAGAGAVRSNAADMIKLLQALMKPPESRIGQAIQLALEPRGVLGAAKIGLGWITTSPPAGAPFTWHNGGTGGYRSFIGFTTDGKAGIVVLTNGADQSPDPLAIQALEQLAR